MFRYNCLGSVNDAPLKGACKRNSLEDVKFLLTRGEDPTETDIEGCNALHFATMFGNNEILKFFLERPEININDKETQGLTPLHIASGALSKQLEQLSKLKDESFDKTVNHSENVKMLVEAGANPTEKDNNGYTPLHWAAYTNRAETVRFLLTKSIVRCDEKDRNGLTPLYLAAYEGHQEIVEILLNEYGADPTKKTTGGQTSLHIAAQNNHVETVRLLLERSEVNSGEQDKEGNTPLHYICFKKDSTKMFCHALHEADKKSKEEYLNDRIEIVKLLLARPEVNPDVKNLKGKTPLHYACMYGFTEVVSLLLERSDVNPNMLDISDWTPLHYACIKGHTEVVRLLLTRGVLFDEKNREGLTPFHHAAKLGFSGIVNLLVTAGVRPDYESFKTSTPTLWYAPARWQDIMM